jgi:hypothetical protein
MFKSLAEAAMTEAQEKEAAAARMQEIDAKMEVAVAQLHEAIATGLLPELVKLLPHIKEAVPHFAKFAKFLGEVAGYAAHNPIKAALLGLGAVISKAILVEVAAAKLGETLSRSVSNSIGGSGGLAIAGAVIAITAATLAVDKMIDDKNKKINANIGGEFATQNAAATLRSKIDAGTATPEDIAAAKQMADKEKASIDKQKGEVGKTGVLEGVVKTLGRANGFGNHIDEAEALEKKIQEDSIKRATGNFDKLTKAIALAEAALQKHADTAGTSKANPAAPDRGLPMPLRGGTTER